MNVPAVVIFGAFMLFLIFRTGGGIMGQSQPGSPEKMEPFIKKAMEQLGKPYIWGAEGPDSFDCSGLVHYAMEQGAGISVPRLVTEQSASAPFSVNVKGKSFIQLKSILQRGDCIGIDSPPGTGRFEHVVIYLGNSKIIQATGGQSCPDSPSRCKVVIDPLTRLSSNRWRSVYSWFR